MAKAVFSTKLDSSYDDLPEMWYHFPKRYLRQAKETEGDWIVYYEPGSSGGRQSYFAVAQVARVVPDRKQPNLLFYAHIKKGTYLEFDRSVPFKEGEFYYESIMHRRGGGINPGHVQRSVRFLPDDEFEKILRAGFAAILETDQSQERAPESAEPCAIYPHPVITSVTNRRFRDRAFAEFVKRSYDNTCAITGLRILNGGGAPEVQAAHIRPVKDEGPDSIRNGLALSQTAHWMFDRGLISIARDYRILTSGKLQPEAKNLIKPDGIISLPDREIERPHPAFLRFHRENIFKE